MGRIRRRRRPKHILKRHREERDGGEKVQPQQGPLPYCNGINFAPQILHMEHGRIL